MFFDHADAPNVANILRSQTQLYLPIALYSSGFSFALFVLVYYFLNRQIAEHQQAKAACQDLLTKHKQTETEKQFVEEDLRRGEEQLRLALEAAHMGTWDWNLLTNQITWSSGHEHLFGLASGTFDGTFETFEACVYPEDLESINQAVNKARLERQDYHHEYRVVWSDGSIHWIEAKGKFFYNETGQAVRMLGTVMDISDRKYQEEQLRLLESVVVNTNDAVVITDTELSHPLGPRIVYINDAFTCMTGYSFEEVKAGTVRLLERVKTNQAALDEIRAALQTWQSVRVDLFVYRKDGSEFWVELSIMPVANEEGSFTHWIAIQRDITTSKQAEADLKQRQEELELRVTERTAELIEANNRLQHELFRREQVEYALRQSEERWQLAIRGSNDGIWDWNIKTDEVFFSSRWKEMLGYEDHEIGNTSDEWRKRVHPDELKQVLQSYQDHVTRKTPFYATEHRLLCKNGTYKWILTRGQALWDEEGNPIRLTGSHTDISHRKQAELARQESEQRLQAILDNATAIIYLKDTQSRYILVNRQFETLWQTPKEQVPGKSDYDFFSKEIAETYRANDLQVIEAGKALQFEESGLSENGIRTFLSIKFPLKDRAGVVYGIGGISTEISDRKRAEEALRKQAFIFENISDGLILTDMEGCIIDWNPAAERIFGYAKSEMLGKMPRILHKPEESAVLMKTIIAEMQKTGRWEGEIHFIRKDGTEGVCETVVVPLPNERGQAIASIGVNRDITERKQAEEERAKLIDILEATPDFIGTVSVEQRTLYLNSAARKVFGFAENEDCTNFSLSEGHPDWAYQIVINEGIPAAIRDGFWVGETAFLSHDGREIPVSQALVAHKSPDGNVKMLSTIARDITLQQQIAATLVEAEQRWRSLLENVRLVVVGLDNKGKVEYVNPCFLDLVGYTKAEVIGQDWFETFLPLHQKTQGQNNFLELLEQQFYTHNQSVILTKSGEEKVIAWNNTLLQDPQGYVIGTLSIGEDVTERQVIERMKDEFISVVSHELRTPLTSIHGALNLLSSGLVGTESEKGRRVIEIAAESAERLVRLVNDILELERLESGKISLSKQTCNAADLMTQAIDMMQVMANRAGITLSVAPQTILLNADSDRLIQLLTNLLGNAIKFSSRGSTVWLTVELRAGDQSFSQEGLGRQGGQGGFSTQYLPSSPHLPISPSPSSSPASAAPPVGQFLTPNPTVLFKIQDQGRGIPADKIESIFERFHQVDASDSRKKGGTGLGLAICRSIVQQHGGRIWVESTLGKGSSFYFTLPGQEIKDDTHGNEAHLSD